MKHILVCFAIPFLIILTKISVASPEVAEKLGGSEYCGLCHTDIYQQWNASSHHFSSFNNPVYRKVIEHNIGLENVTTRRFCSNCHDPLLKAADQDRINIKSWQANSGITCLSCHRMDKLGAKNGDYVINEPFLHPFTLARSPTLQKTHKFVTENLSWLHNSMVSKPEYQAAEFCGSCHTAEVPAAINGQNKLTVLSEYQDWQHSSYAQLQDGKPAASCQSCHMPLFASADPAAKNGMVHDHSFAAGNTLLPTINRDFKHLEKAAAFLTSDIITLAVESIYNHDGNQISVIDPTELPHAAELTVNINVYNQGVGHYFPGGTADSNEAWLAIEYLDANNNVLYATGMPQAQESLGSDVTRFGMVFVDSKGLPTHRGTTTSKAVAIQTDTRIAPQTAKKVKLKLQPESWQDVASIRISLNWRKYDPKFLAWVFAGRSPPEQPITVMDYVYLPFAGKVKISLH